MRTARLQQGLCRWRSTAPVFGARLDGIPKRVLAVW